MLVRAATSDQAEHGRFPRIRKQRLVSIRDLALPAVVPGISDAGVEAGGSYATGATGRSACKAAADHLESKHNDTPVRVAKRGCGLAGDGGDGRRHGTRLATRRNARRDD